MHPTVRNMTQWYQHRAVMDKQSTQPKVMAQELIADASDWMNHLSSMSSPWCTLPLLLHLYR